LTNDARQLRAHFRDDARVLDEPPAERNFSVEQCR
jgi:hypothetical protein